MSAGREHDTRGAILHFTHDEYRVRVERAVGALAEQQLDGKALVSLAGEWATSRAVTLR